MVFLIYSVINSNKKEQGKIYISDCPDKNMAEKLYSFGDYGYKFLEVVQTIFDTDTVHNIELINIVENINYTKDMVIIPWKWIIC